jgi:hypothetical protein
MLNVHSRTGALAEAEGLSFPKTDFKLFPCFHVVGLPPYQQYTHTMFPLGPDRTRGQIRMYWTGPSSGAWCSFVREFLTMSIRDVLCEDREAVEASQQGMQWIDQLHFQEHEVLLRHLYEEARSRVEDFIALRPG